MIETKEEKRLELVQLEDIIAEIEAELLKLKQKREYLLKEIEQ